MRISDPHIFDKIQKGDVSAFNILFDESYTNLCFFANKYLSDIDLSRSIVQQVFVDIWIKREKIKIHSSLKTYLYNSVKNRSLDYIQKEKRIVPYSVNYENMEAIPFQDLVEEAELNDRINSSINKLPGRCREIFILCRFEGLKYSEIAERLNISVKTVEMQMGIALKKMRNYLSEFHMFRLLLFVLSKKD